MCIRDSAGGYRYGQVIGLKVKYDEQVLREAEHSPQRTEELRQETYEAAKKKMLQALLALEREFPGSTTIMAGGCTLCRTCARAKGEPCRDVYKRQVVFSVVISSVSSSVEAIFSVTCSLCRSDSVVFSSVPLFSGVFCRYPSQYTIFKSFPQFSTDV